MTGGSSSKVPYWNDERLFVPPLQNRCPRWRASPHLHPARSSHEASLQDGVRDTQFVGAESIARDEHRSCECQTPRRTNLLDTAATHRIPTRAIASLLASSIGLTLWTPKAFATSVLSLFP